MSRILLCPLICLMFPLLTVGCREATNSDADSADGNGKTSAVDLAEMRKYVQSKNREFTEAHITGQKDSVVMVNYFTRDAKIFPPGSDLVSGQDAIAELTSLYMKYPIFEFREETTDFYGNDELLVDEGNYVMVHGEDSTMEYGKYVNVWEMEDGEWKVSSNIWNVNSPGSTPD